MICVGQVVYQKNGRDKGLPFIITKLSGDYAYVANGKNRTLNKPKRKKIKHLQIKNTVDENIKTKLLNNEYILDSDIKSSLRIHYNTIVLSKEA